MTFRPRSFLNVAGPLRIFSLLLVIGIIAITVMIYKKTAYSLPFLRYDKLEAAETKFYWGKTYCVGEEQYARVIGSPWKDRFNYPDGVLWLAETRVIYRIFKATMLIAGMAGYFTFIWIMLLLFGGISAPIKKNYVLYIDIVFHLIAGMFIITCGMCLLALLPFSKESLHMHMDQCLRDMNVGTERIKVVPYIEENHFGPKGHICLEPQHQLLRIIDTILVIVTGLTYLAIGIIQLILHKFCCCKIRVKSK